jgi:hypothetical protein
VTLAADPRGDAVTRPTPTAGRESAQPVTGGYDHRPVEFWSTAAIRAAVESGDLATWQRIALALKRDPYGRTARQVEEVLENVSPYGISEALSEVLGRSRARLEADELDEVARQVRMMLDRSGLSSQEFASRTGVSGEEFAAFLGGDASPSATQMVRMQRLSDRFARMKAQRTGRYD